MKFGRIVLQVNIRIDRRIHAEKCCNLVNTHTVYAQAYAAVSASSWSIV